jgi:hypothetical protein
LARQRSGEKLPDIAKEVYFFGSVAMIGNEVIDARSEICLGSRTRTQKGVSVLHRGLWKTFPATPGLLQIRFPRIGKFRPN